MGLGVQLRTPGKNVQSIIHRTIRSPQRQERRYGPLPDNLPRFGEKPKKGREEVNPVLVLTRLSKTP